jgi:hypothetical protein
MQFVAATFTVWGVFVFGWFKFFDGEKNKTEALINTIIYT